MWNGGASPRIMWIYDNDTSHNHVYTIIMNNNDIYIQTYACIVYVGIITKCNPGNGNPLQIFAVKE